MSLDIFIGHRNLVFLTFSSTYILGKILGQMLVQMYLKKFASPMKPLDPGPYAKAHPMAQYDKAPIKPSSMFLIRMFTVFLDLKMMIIIKSKLRNFMNRIIPIGII